MKRTLIVPVTAVFFAIIFSCAKARTIPPWEYANPIQPLPVSPIGIDFRLTDLKDPPTRERIRLGRWLFYDVRLSADGTIACASCHRAEYGFSEPTPHSTGVQGRKGTRKSPSILNQAWASAPHFFWDGRAASLEEQALGPIANPVEMGSTHEEMIASLTRIRSYARYFNEAFGTPEITEERVAKAIADYERSCMTGNSAWDRWKATGDDAEVSADVVRGDALFFGKAACNRCHVGPNLTDSAFHNVGIGWDEAGKRFSDEGRFAVTGNAADHGAFKTPALRDVALHPPYMHDGSLPALRDVVLHYSRGGTANPALDPKMEPLALSDEDVNALVSFLEALSGEVEREKAPAAFPQ